MVRSPEFAVIVRFGEKLVTRRSLPRIKALVREWSLDAGKIDLERTRRQQERDAHMLSHGEDQQLRWYKSKKDRPNVPNPGGCSWQKVYFATDSHGKQQILKGWLPNELDEKNDPESLDLLPLGSRQLTIEQKIIILAAIHAVVSDEDTAIVREELQGLEVDDVAAERCWLRLLAVARDIVERDECRVGSRAEVDRQVREIYSWIERDGKAMLEVGAGWDQTGETCEPIDVDRPSIKASTPVSDDGRSLALGIPATDKPVNELQPNAVQETMKRLLGIYTDGLVDDRLTKCNNVLLDGKLTVNAKLTKIDTLMPIPPTTSAEKLGKMLGVTKRAVTKTEWWAENRQGKKERVIARRETSLRQRGKQRDRTDLSDPMQE